MRNRKPAPSYHNSKTTRKSLTLNLKLADYERKFEKIPLGVLMDDVVRLLYGKANMGHFHSRFARIALRAVCEAVLQDGQCHFPLRVSLSSGKLLRHARN